MEGLQFHRLINMEGCDHLGEESRVGAQRHPAAILPNTHAGAVHRQRLQLTDPLSGDDSHEEGCLHRQVLQLHGVYGLKQGLHERLQYNIEAPFGKNSPPRRA